MANDSKYDICVIGGGASGVMAAIAAKRAGALSVVVLEREERVLKKLLVTGNGRCNFTNIAIKEADCAVDRYIGENSGFARRALCAFGFEETLDFFFSIGIERYIDERGRVYPRSLQASAVVDALRFEAQALGVEIITGAAVRLCVKSGRGFTVSAGIGRGTNIYCNALIISTGGVGAGATRLFERFGHTATRITPAITQLLCDDPICKSLKGIRVEARVSAISDDAVIAQEIGDVLFTDTGVSGNAVFALSHRWHDNPQADLSIDFAPEYSACELSSLLIKRKTALSRLPKERFLDGFINKRVGYMIMKRGGLTTPAAHVEALSREFLSELAHELKNLRLSIKATAGYKHAQVTAGGIRTAEFYEYSLESRLAPGLFAAGEALDITGECGGFNLQWAWSSGFVAGTSAALSLNRRGR